MKKTCYYLILFFVLQSCKNKTTENLQNNVNQNHFGTENAEINEIQNSQAAVTYTDIFTFESYNDNGDYSFLIAKKGNDTYDFVNDGNLERNLLRGDSCEIQWKVDTIFIAGDDETPEATDWLISIKKSKDGKVSQFRKQYKKEIKYHFINEEYSPEYANEIYLLVEYYIANSKNETIKSSIQNNNQIEYSINNKTVDNKTYEVIEIGQTLESEFTTVQTIYIDRETQLIYEYNPTNEKLIVFK